MHELAPMLSSRPASDLERSALRLVRRETALLASKLYWPFIERRFVGTGHSFSASRLSPTQGRVTTTQESSEMKNSPFIN